MRGKYYKIVLTAAACSLLFSMSSLAADQLGEMTRVTDTVAAEGEHGRITTTISGITDDEGCLAIPLYEDAEMISVTAGSGTLEGEPKEQTTGMTTYLVARFAEKSGEVNLEIIWDQNETYKMKGAKTKGTAPGNLKAVKYTMVNNTPTAIGNYQLHFAVPDGYELAAIVGYDPEEEYEIKTIDGHKFGSYHFGVVPVGQESSMTINIKKAGGNMAVLMWGITLVVSAFFLYKNREMPKEAKALAAKKKLEKQGGQSK